MDDFTYRSASPVATMSNKAHIDVYARVRPVKRPSSNMEIDFANHAIGIHMAKGNSERDVINNQRENYSFAFSRILDASTTQDQVFDVVAAPVVDSVLEGFNGTILAYGQTGSGQSFTMVGRPTEQDRGLEPRLVESLFARAAAAPARAIRHPPGCIGGRAARRKIHWRLKCSVPLVSSRSCYATSPGERITSWPDKL